MNKYYVVLECGGEYEDYYEKIIGVCPTLSLAESLKNKVEDSLSYKGNLPIDKMEELIHKLEELIHEFWNSDLDVNEDDADGIHKLHPEYSLEDIEFALKYYYNNNDEEIVIREINFYENENDFKQCYKEILSNL